MKEKNALGRKFAIVWRQPAAMIWNKSSFTSLPALGKWFWAEKLGSKSKNKTTQICLHRKTKTPKQTKDEFLKTHT